MSAQHEKRSKSGESPERSPESRPRRSLLRALWVGLGAVALAEAAWVALSFLRPRKGPGGEAADPVVVAGPAERFEVGTVTAFPRGRFYLARLEDGGFLAMGRECTHLGCTVAWEEKEMRFLCPCHASAFDLRGDVLSPPAPRALDLYAVSIENQEVRVDTAKRSRRSAFDPSQAVHV